MDRCCQAAHFHALTHSEQVFLALLLPVAGARNRHTCDGVCAWRGVCKVCITSQTPSAERCCHILHAQQSTECVRDHFVISDTAYLSDHWYVVPAKLLLVRRSRCQVSLGQTYRRLRLSHGSWETHALMSAQEEAYAIPHLAMMASLHPLSAHSMSPRY